MQQRAIAAWYAGGVKISVGFPNLRHMPSENSNIWILLTFRTYCSSDIMEKRGVKFKVAHEMQMSEIHDLLMP